MGLGMTVALGGLVLGPLTGGLSTIAAAIAAGTVGGGIAGHVAGSKDEKTEKEKSLWSCPII